MIRSFYIVSPPNPSHSTLDGRYDFKPPVKYNYLDADEAEEKFEKRNKTLNYFSIMLSKKLKHSEDGEEGRVAGLGESKDLKIKEKKKKVAADSGLVRVSNCLEDICIIGVMCLVHLFYSC